MEYVERFVEAVRASRAQFALETFYRIPHRPPAFLVSLVGVEAK
jgi:hypothetical protein